MPGKIFVTDSCFDCGNCRDLAPANFIRDEDCGVSYVYKQPETPEELALCLEALIGCPTESIGDTGDQQDWSVPTPKDAARCKYRDQIAACGGVDPFNEPAYERNRERLAQNERKWRDSLEIKKQNGSGADNPCDQPVGRCCHPGVSNGASAKDDRPPVPTALLTVAALFLLYGTATLPGTFLSIAAGFPNIDMGVLGIPTFFGLRRFSRGWRTFALVLIWLAFIGCLAGVGFGFAQDKYSTVHVFGIVLKEVEPIWVSAASVPVFLIALWGYRVLTRPTIRALFYEGPRERVSATV